MRPRRALTHGRGFALAVLLLAAGWLAVWSSWPTLRYSHDAVAYAALVHRAAYTGALEVLWHPYHMLYMPLGWLLVRALLALGLVVDVLGLLQVMNLLLSSALVAAAAAATRRLTGRSGLALGVAALLAASLTVSYYATDPEVYPPALLALTVAFTAFLGLLERGRTIDAVWSGAAAGLACGFHAAAAVAAPPLVVVAALGAPGPPRRRLTLAAVLAAAFTLPAAAPYAVMWAGHDLTPAAGAAALVRDVAGTRSFESGPWLLGRGFRPEREARAVLEGVAADPVVPSPTLGAAAVAARLGVVGLVLLVAARWPELWRRHRWPAALLGAWLLGFFALFSAYNVGALKFVGFQLLPLLLLVGAAASTLSGRWLTAAAAAITVIALLAAWGNLVGTVIPWSEPGSNPALERARWVAEQTSPGDVVVLLGQGPQALQRIYLPYFAEREVILLDLAYSDRRRSARVTTELVAGAITARLARGDRVMALGELLGDPDLVGRFEARYELPPGTVAGLLGRFDERRLAARDDGFALWLLRPPPATGRTAEENPLPSVQ